MELPLPPGEHASLLLVLPDGIWAAERDGPLPPIKFRRSNAPKVHALYYACPLEGLGIAPGWQKTAEDAPLLPEPVQVFEATLGEPWAEVDPPAELRGIRIETKFDCAQFLVTPVALEGVPGSGGRALADAGDGRFLFASVAGRFFLVTRESATLIDTPTTTPHVASFTAGDGTIWLLGERGRLARYRVESGFEEAGATASGSGSGDTGDLSGLGSELYAVSNQGFVDRFDGVSWQTIVDDPLEDHDSPGIAVLGPSHAIAIGPRDGIAIRYRDGSVTPEVVGDLPIDFGLNAIAYVPGLGTVIGTVRGQHWVNRDQRWERIEDPPSSNPVRALAPFGGGFLSGTINGFAAQWHPQLGFCETVQVAPNGITRIVPTGTGFALTAIHELAMEDQPDVVTFVDVVGGTSCGN